MTTPGVLDRRRGLWNGEYQRVSEPRLQISTAGRRRFREIWRGRRARV